MEQENKVNTQRLVFLDTGARPGDGQAMHRSLSGFRIRGRVL